MDWEANDELLVRILRRVGDATERADRRRTTDDELAQLAEAAASLTTARVDLAERVEIAERVEADETRANSVLEALGFGPPEPVAEDPL